MARLIPALCLFLGALLASLRWNGVLTYSLVAVTGILLFVAIVTPDRYAPIYLAQEKLLQMVVRAFSWTALAVVFALVFIPGRLLLSLFSNHRMTKRATNEDSCWRKLPSTISDKARFTRQF